jgi:hypothetical protein
VPSTARARRAGVLASVAETSPFCRREPTHHVTRGYDSSRMAAPATPGDSRIRWRRYPRHRQSPTGRPSSGLRRLRKWPSALCGWHMTSRETLWSSDEAVFSDARSEFETKVLYRRPGLELRFLEIRNGRCRESSFERISGD